MKARHVLTDAEKARMRQARIRRHERGLPNADDPRHGTINGYMSYGCRCNDCREANAAEKRRQRAEMKEQAC